METDDRRAPALIFFSIRNLSDFSETEISSLISNQKRGYKRNNIVSVLLVFKKKNKIILQNTRQNFAPLD